MELNKVNIESLNNAKYNPRKDLKPTDAEYVKLKNSVEHFGYVDPVIVNKRNMTVVGGHQRLKVLKDLGYKDIDVVYVDLNETDEKALNIALNKISGDWDAEKLEDLLREISLDTDFDVELTGFTSSEIETLFNGSLDKDDENNDINSADNEIDEEIKKNREKHAGGLLEKCGGFAPFSVLDAGNKKWQDRKKQWIDKIGIQSEVGRNAVVLNSGNFLKKMGVTGNIAKNYTSIFDPVLCEVMYKWFCIKGGIILDPFAGGSVRGIVASELGYKYTGIELRKEQVEANRNNYREVCRNPEYAMCSNKCDYEISDPTWICDDSTNMDEHINNEFADMIFTCPPYADLEVYSDDERDISNKKYDEFIKLYSTILEKAATKLKNNRFFVLVIGEVRDKTSTYYYNFVGDTISIMVNKCKLHYYNEMILKTANGGLMLTCGQAFNKYRKIGKCHQNILVFYKGDDFKEIKDTYGNVISEEELNKEADVDERDTETPAGI